MEVKKLKRQLVAAIAMVLVSVLAFSVATYAWYASSSKVTADGIAINAKTEGTSFEIATRDEAGNEPTLDTWPAGQTLATSKIQGEVTLIPVHPEVLTTGYDGSEFSTTAEWFHAFSKDYDDANVSTDTTKVTGLDVNYAAGKLATTENAYALVADFYVRLNPNTAGEKTVINNLKAKDIVITDNSTGKDNKLSGCVYLLVAGEEGAYEISTEANLTGETVVNAAAESDVLIEQIATTDLEPHKITVYAFFEGKDTDCKSANYNANGLAISVSFEGEPGTIGD